MQECDQVQFRVDFPAWLLTPPARHRRVVRMMMRDERATDVGARIGLSPARVSQLRRVFEKGWRRYCGDDGWNG